MPVIINEIQITTTVGTGGGNAPAAQPAAGAAPASSGGGKLSLAEKQELVAACVDEIMRMLKEKQER
jgi:Family of unknown function (DUF5908)